MFRQIISHELANLSSHTALLEACGWNEEELNSVLDYVSDFLTGLKPRKDATWIDLKVGIYSHLNSVYGKDISDIIINALESTAKEIKFYMELPTDD